MFKANAFGAILSLVAFPAAGLCSRFVLPAAYGSVWIGVAGLGLVAPFLLWASALGTLEVSKGRERVTLTRMIVSVTVCVLVLTFVRGGVAGSLLAIGTSEAAGLLVVVVSALSQRHNALHARQARA